MIWGGLRDLCSNEPNQCEPNQSTYRQHLPKVCVQQLHGQDADWFWIFGALLVHFGLGIICQEGICQIWTLGFLIIRSNLEVQKKWGVNVEMSLYLRRRQIFDEGSILIKCSMLYWGLKGSIQFLIFENIYVLFRWGSSLDWKVIFHRKFKNGYWEILLVDM